MAHIEMAEPAADVDTNNAQHDEKQMIQVVDNPQLENKSVTKDTTLDNNGKRKRLYWIDWCRTQSVLNVVLGHIWTDVLLQTGFDRDYPDRMKPPWDERSRMCDYGVDHGTLHTIPMFFLLSGFLNSYTFRAHKKDGIKTFIMKRVMRLLPPWVFGGLLFSLSQMGFMNKAFTVDYFFFSHLWFIWALAAFTAGCLPYHILLRTLIIVDREVSVKLLRQFKKEDHLVTAEQGPGHTRICGLKRQVYVPLVIVGNILLVTLYGIIWDLLFGVLKSGRIWWLLHLPIISVLTPTLVWIGTKVRSLSTKDNFDSMMFLADCLQVMAALLVPLAMFFILGAHDACPNSKCSQNTFFTVNLFYSITVAISCNMAGITFGEVREQCERVISKTSWTKFLAVFALLMSWAWPFFTYWGWKYMKGSGMLKMYQYESNTNVTEVPDPLYKNGGGIMYAQVRMWFWILSMLLFAKAYCDHLINKHFHAHMTQSGMVFYLIHRCFTPILVKSFLAGGTTDITTLWLVVSIVTYVLCFIVYGIFFSNKYTRSMFGLIPVK